MSQKKSLYMGTTQISAEKSAAEIASVLVQAGATQISTEYADGKIIGLRWIMRADGRDILFAMPARIGPILKLLKQASSLNQERLSEQATRVAWRQLLRWVQAQVAMIETGMTEPTEVFFPYIQTPFGQTLFDTFKAGQLKALPPGDAQ